MGLATIISLLQDANKNMRQRHLLVIQTKMQRVACCVVGIVSIETRYKEERYVYALKQHVGPIGGGDDESPFVLFDWAFLFCFFD